MRTLSLSLLVSLALLNACKCDDNTQRVFAVGAWVPQGGLVISGDEAVLDFGELEFGRSQQVTIEITNVAEARLGLSAPAANGPFTREQLVASLRSEESAAWTVTFTPHAELAELHRDFEEEVIVATEGTQNAQVLRLHLRGAGFAPPVVSNPCSLLITPPALEFGLVGFEQTRTQRVELKNVGGEPCTISSTALNAEGLAEGFTLAAENPAHTLAVDAGETVAVTATGKPDAGSRDGRLELSVLDAGFYVVPLHATYGQDCIQVLPSPVDFAFVPVGCSETRTVTAYNTCTTPQAMSGVSTDNSAFTTDGGAAAFDGGASTTFAVTFTPTALGATAANLVVLSDEGTRFVELTGVAVGNSQITETFQALNKIDLLIAGEMFHYDQDAGDDPDAAELEFARNIDKQATAMQLVLAGMADAGTDFHAAALATIKFPRPITQPGRYVPFDAGVLLHLPDGGVPTGFITNSTIDGMQRWDELMRTLPRAFGFCAGSHFEMLTRALTPPYSTTANANFMRTDVPLATIVLSTWDDESRTNWSQYQAGCNVNPYAFLATDYHLNDLRQRGGRLDSLSAVTTAPFGLPCELDWLPQTRLLEMIDLTGGVAVDYCASAEVIASALLDGAFATMRTFRLRGTPDTPTSIVVKVNDFALDPAEWTYLPATNSVRLGVAPPANAVITVTYFPVCHL